MNDPRPITPPEIFGAALLRACRPPDQAALTAARTDCMGIAGAIDKAVPLDELHYDEDGLCGYLVWKDGKKYLIRISEVR